jgi:hypothetical protein
MIIEKLARVHVVWWNNPTLGNEIGEPLDIETTKAMEHRLIDTVSAFLLDR